MARQLRVEYPGAIYHATVRMLGDRPLPRLRSTSVPSPGGARLHSEIYAGQDSTNWPKESRLFRDNADRERFVASLADRVEQFNIRLYLYCLLTNHVHLVFETPEGNCGKFMQSLATAYTVYFNLRHHRHGHLMDGRYKAKLVEGDKYLLVLSRYVHLNPVQLGALKDKPMEERISYLRQYRWSSYPSYIGLARALDFVAYGPMLGEMGGKRGEWPRRYRDYVESGLTGSDQPSPGYGMAYDDFNTVLKASPRSIGSDSFRVWVDEMYQELVKKHRRLEDVSFRRITEPLAFETVLEILGKVFEVQSAVFRQRHRNSVLRAIASRLLVRFVGMNQRQVAEQLGMGTGGAVSAQIRRLPGLLAADQRLRRQYEQAEARLEDMRKESAARCNKQ